MNTVMTPSPPARVSQISREALIHQLYEAAELEHNLMCTYLYAAFSLRQGTAEGLSEAEAEATARWRRTILQVAIEEMGHLTAVWNITAALGGSPRFGRLNFPLDPGGLPASVVVRLEPFTEAVLQHFIFLERPHSSDEPDGEGFKPDWTFRRGDDRAATRVTPMPIDYDTVGSFYDTLTGNLKAFVARVGEKDAFCGDRNLQISRKELDFQGCDPVICSITALKAFDAIVSQGEGAESETADSHYCRFLHIRDELRQLKAANPEFKPAWPAAVNPVLRRPVRAGARVWLENEDVAATVDLANSAYMLMLRLISHSYLVPRPHPDKALCIDLALGLMRAVSPLAERAARLPAGPTNPGCNGGMSFTALRESAPLPPGTSAGRFFVERARELVEAAKIVAASRDPRAEQALRILTELAQRAERRFAELEKLAPVPLNAAPAAAAVPAPVPATRGGAAVIEPGNVAPTPRTVDGVDYIEGRDLTLIYEGKKCIHSRFCVTWGPKVFIANVKGPWINPDAMSTEALTEIAHVCVSGAIRYQRKDGQPDEQAPPVNLISVREGGPYALKADIRLDGAAAGNFRYTLCRCGASKNKPFCDGSHHEVHFDASGEPPTGKADMLPVRDGPLEVTPLTDGPLQVRGNVEIISGTGRVVARVESARLCRCGGSNTKPFCDGTHAKIGFRSQ
jgi:CDGSH-type Zn-finger protein/uncharacterized Fe-S cluster protein YjdI